jgi:hypothetical protein
MLDNLTIIIPLIIISILGFIYYRKSTEGMLNKTTEQTSKNEEEFIPSEKFIGEKKGYIFKNDSRGIGYYKDYFKNQHFQY